MPTDFSFDMLLNRRLLLVWALLVLFAMEAHGQQSQTNRQRSVLEAGKGTHFVFSDGLGTQFEQLRNGFESPYPENSAVHEEIRTVVPRDCAPSIQTPQNFDVEKVHPEDVVPADIEMTCNCERRDCRICCRIQTIRRQIHGRELSPGDMSPRWPYQTDGFYYYQRPYNQGHVQQEAQLNFHSNGPTAPYSNQVFNDLHQSMQNGFPKHLEAQSERELVEDGLLEYSDWREHRKARTETGSLPKRKKLSEPSPLYEAHSGRPDGQLGSAR